MKQNDVVEIKASGDIGVIDSYNGMNTVWVRTNGELKCFRPENLTKPKTVKSFDGKTDVIIKAHQDSLRNWPMNLRAGIDDHGTPYLTGAIYSTPKCGCEIIGNGTLQFPLSINFCKKHKS